MYTWKAFLVFSNQSLSFEDHKTRFERLDDEEKRNADEIYVFAGLEQARRNIVFFQCRGHKTGTGEEIIRRERKKKSEIQKDEANVVICDGRNAHGDDLDVRTYARTNVD